MKLRQLTPYSLAVLVCLTGCRDEIFHDLSESDANRIVAELDAASISAHKSRGSDSKWNVSVDRNASAHAIRILNDRRALPVTRISTGAKSLLPSREDELLRHERQLSSGIEETLRNISGVLEARVHLNLPKKRDIFEPRAKIDSGSGAVLLIVGTNFVESREEITSLVANASGVSRAEIAVVISHSGSGSSEAPKIDTGSSLDPNESISYSSRTQLVLSFSALACIGLLGWGGLRVRRRKTYLSPSRV